MTMEVEGIAMEPDRFFQLEIGHDGSPVPGPDAAGPAGGGYDCVLAAATGEGLAVLGDALVDLVDGEAGRFRLDRPGRRGYRGGSAHQQVGGKGAERVLGSLGQLVFGDVLGHLPEQDRLAGQGDLADSVEVAGGGLRHQPGGLADHHVRRDGDLRRRIAGGFAVAHLHRLHDLTVQGAGVRRRRLGLLEQALAHAGQRRRARRQLHVAVGGRPAAAGWRLPAGLAGGGGLLAVAGWRGRGFLAEAEHVWALLGSRGGSDTFLVFYRHDHRHRLETTAVEIWFRACWL